MTIDEFHEKLIIWEALCRGMGQFVRFEDWLSVEVQENMDKKDLESLYSKWDNEIYQSNYAKFEDWHYEQICPFFRGYNIRAEA